MDPNRKPKKGKGRSRKKRIHLWFRKEYWKWYGRKRHRANGSYRK